MGIERRKYLRVPVVAEVECEQTGTSFLLPSRDVSVGGLFLRTREEFPPDTLLQVRFRPDGETLIEAQGRVVYTIPGLGIGVEFTELPASQRQALLAFIEKQQPAS